MEQQVTIINKLGLHLRAAKHLVQTASESECEITVSCNGQEADAKSIMDVLMLAATQGTEVVINIEGDSEDEEEEAMTALVNLIKDRFTEAE